VCPSGALGHRTCVHPGIWGNCLCGAEGEGEGAAEGEGEGAAEGEGEGEGAAEGEGEGAAEGEGEGEACLSDRDCLFGLEWCEQGTCGPCRDDGSACLIRCPEGYALYSRHGCQPCECKAINECLVDDECAYDLVCTPGDDCTDWCPPGDPTCCHGNLCLEPPVCGDPTLAARFADCTAATTEPDCLAAGGSWARVGRSPEPVCDCPTGQAGCPCDRAADCLGSCLVELPVGETCAEQRVGSCHAWSHLVGCHCVFREAGTPVEICID